MGFLFIRVNGFWFELGNPGWVGIQEAGGRRQEAGGRGQGSRVRGQGVRGQESGGRGRGSGVRGQNSVIGRTSRLEEYAQLVSGKNQEVLGKKMPDGKPGQS
jgi:hypothetical protein